MSKRLIAAALSALVAAGAVGARTTADRATGGVTTLQAEPSAPGVWQPPGNSDGTSSFTSIAVIKNGALTPSVDAPQDPSVQIMPEAIAPPAAQSAADPAKAAPGSVGAQNLGSRISHLPEPGVWALLIIGLGMIGFAVRGLVAANRRLARLEAPENPEA